MYELLKTPPSNGDIKMALEGSGTTMAVPEWMNYKAPEAKLDAQDGANLEAVDIRRQQIFNPKIMGSTTCSTGWKKLHAGLTLEAGVRLKAAANGDNLFIGVAGATEDTVGWELRSGEEIFLEVNNLNLVSRLGSAADGCTLSYIAT